MKRIFFALAFLLMIALGGCNLPMASSPLSTQSFISTQVAATFRAFTQIVAAQETQALLATPTLPPPTGSPTPSATPTVTLPTATASQTPTITATFTNSPTVTPRPGSISGQIIGYPYGNIPRLAIVAFDQKAHYLTYWYWITAAGETYYSMDNYIPPSTYQVVAYDNAGHAGGCTQLVVVTSDTMATCNITDWSGSYPAKPAGVPSP